MKRNQRAVFAKLSSAATLTSIALSATLVGCSANPAAMAPESGSANYGQQGYPSGAYPTAQPTSPPMVTSDVPMTLEQAEADLQNLEKGFGDPSMKLSAAPDACMNACKALSSMKRAAERICELTAPANDRCSSARERVQKVETRVTQECPVCP